MALNVQGAVFQYSYLAKLFEMSHEKHEPETKLAKWGPNSQVYGHGGLRYWDV
jgi:hypothetical protein